jgi:hypothetical protein
MAAAKAAKTTKTTITTKSTIKKTTIIISELSTKYNFSLYVFVRKYTSFFSIEHRLHA